jgi:truncated hemoglobin YjbI
MDPYLDPVFSSEADKMPTKNKFFEKFFAYTTVFKDKKSKRSHKIVKSRFFLLFLLVDGFYGVVCWFL